MPHCYSTISNMRRYGLQLQNQILLFYCIFLSPLPQIPLSPSTLSHFFFLYHSLSLPSPPCSRKLLKITLHSSSQSRHLTFQSSLPISPVLAADLAPSFSTTHRRSRRLMLQPSSSTSTAFTADLQISLNRVVGVRFGMGFDVGFGSALYGLWVEVLGWLGWGFRPIVG